MIYFIKSKKCELFKIGYSEDCLNRLAKLRWQSPDRLKLILVIEGSKEIEKELHSRFRNSLSHGEWFHDSPELQRYLRREAFPSTRVDKADWDDVLHYLNDPKNLVYDDDVISHWSRVPIDIVARVRQMCGGVMRYRERLDGYKRDAINPGHPLIRPRRRRTK